VSLGKQFKSSYLEKTHHKKWLVKWLNSEGSEFKPEYHQKTKTKKIQISNVTENKYSNKTSWKTGGHGTNGRALA
jgi:hypothetical protein